MSDGGGLKLQRIRRRSLALLSWRARPFGLSRMLVLALILLLFLTYFDQVSLQTVLVGLGFFVLAAITIRLDQRRYLRRMRRFANTRKALSEQLLRADVQITDFAEIFSGIHDAILLLDRRLNILMVSGTARQLFPSALSGIPFANAVRHPVALRVVESAILDDVTLGDEYRVSTPVERELRIEARPFRTRNKATYILVSVFDLTEQHKLAQLRSDFIANASHELKTPLTALIGCLETLDEMADEKNEIQTKFLNMGLEQASRMQGLVLELLSLSQVEMQEHRPPATMINLTEIIHDVVHSLQERSEQARITILDQLPASLLVVGDQRQMNQVFVNLIENAIKYGREGGQVVVSVSEEPAPRSGMVGVAVADNGIGIARMDVPRLTERFYRVSHGKSGTGLGLAIVKHIISRHRGHLTIGSQPGQGSVFTVWLPSGSTSEKDV